MPPSMANNELSGPWFYQDFTKNKKMEERKFNYRFVINPETIGTCYLKKNKKN